MVFSKESLKHSIRPVIIVVLVCLLVWMWGNNRKVDVSLTLRPEIRGSEQPTRIDMTVYKDGTEDVEATFSTQIASDRLAVQQLSMRPGTYFMRGIVSTPSGNTHIVTQTIVVPEDNASIEIYLREK
ncbi:MAG: hypothetical protein IJU23_09705 [Proteobacteria bacterium]|nr:hypothetical protein [Pseudomonadota bacterium]